MKKNGAGVFLYIYNTYIIKGGTLLTASSSLSLESNEVHVTAPSYQESMSPLSNHGVVIPTAESLRNQLTFSSRCLKILHLVVDTAVSFRSWRWKKKHSN